MTKKKKHKPDPEILALMATEEREKLLHRKAKPATGQEAGSKSKWARIERQLVPLREEGGRPSEPEKKQGKPSAYLKSEVRRYSSDSKGEEGERYGSGSKRKTANSLAGPNKSTSGQRVSKTAALDYIYERLNELTEIILSNKDPEREEAKKERAFLEGQLKIAYSRGQRTITLDPALARLVRESTLRSPRSRPKDKTPNPQPRKAPAPPTEQPSYWAECRKMDFRQLRKFIDGSLRELSVSGLDRNRPRSKGEFLALWEMLRGKIDTSDLPAILPSPAEPPEFPPFAPSEQLKSLLDQQKQFAAALAEARRNPSATKRSIRKLRRKLNVLEQDISPLDERERQDHAKHRDAYYRPYGEARRAHQHSIRQRDTKRERLPQLRTRRLQITERIRRDIERAFEFGGKVIRRQLPWRVLPPGELSAATIRQHYDKLQRSNPQITDLCGSI